MDIDDLIEKEIIYNYAIIHNREIIEVRLEEIKTKIIEKIVHNYFYEN